MAARSNTASMIDQPSPATPRGSALAPAKVILAWLRVGSMVSTASRVTPAPVRSTMNSETPRASLPGAGRRSGRAAREVGPVPVGPRDLGPADRPARNAGLDGLRRHRPRALTEGE